MHAVSPSYPEPTDLSQLVIQNGHKATDVAFQLRGEGGLYDPTGYLLGECHPIISLGNKFYSGGESGFSLCCRDVARERASVERYLGRLADLGLPDIFVDGERHTYSEAVASLATSLPPMSPCCRAVVTVPVHQEGAVLDRFLTAYLMQRGIQSGTVEFNFIINGPEGYIRDNSLAQILSVDREYRAAGHLLTVLDVEFPKSDSNVGLARRVQHDVMLVRSLRREQEHPLYFVQEDADTFDVNPSWLNDVILYLDSHPHVDAVRGFPDRDVGTLVKNDLLLLERRLTQLTELLYFRRNERLREPFLAYGQNLSPDQAWLRPFTQGCMGAITAESLSLIAGGFDSAVSLEDLKLGWKLSTLRGIPTSEGIYLSTESIHSLPHRSQSSARRFVQAVYELAHDEIEYVTPYRKFGDESNTRKLRNMEIEEILADSSVSRLSDFTKLSKAEVISQTNRLLNFYKGAIQYVFPLDAVGSSEQNLRNFASFLSIYLVGREGSISSNGEDLKLVKPEALAETLERYRRRYQARLFRFQET